ncbi:MAG TPA: methyltransferase domain-containing protein [Vicinamibacterales bacterium]|nr:methyltransferase domain-containing protein [Vicinamibacterales bacterium]
MRSNRFRILARNWELFGRQDPMFGVLSDPAKQHGRWAVDEFFESGRAHVAKLFRMLAERNVAFTLGCALDFGCGVGRLTQPIAARFERTIGVDVAPSMIREARRYNTQGPRCEFVLNTAPDLRRFATASTDFVHSCLVLQHIPSDVSLRYIAEFLRVARPGGLVVFQVPAQVYSETEINDRLALPPEACRAVIQVTDVPSTMEAGSTSTVTLRVTNASVAVWPLDIPGGRHISVANHWLDARGGERVADDGRARLPHDLAPGQTGEVHLAVTAPRVPGEYVLEIDLVQEHICWFAQRGSVTSRVPVSVSQSPHGPHGSHGSLPPADRPEPRGAREGLVARFKRLVQRPAPFFEMHVVPRSEVERVVQRNGGRVLHAIDDGAAGAGWLSYTYICRHD